MSQQQPLQQHPQHPQQQQQQLQLKQQHLQQQQPSQATLSHALVPSQSSVFLATTTNPNVINNINHQKDNPQSSLKTNTTTNHQRQKVSPNPNPNQHHLQHHHHHNHNQQQLQQQQISQQHNNIQLNNHYHQQTTLQQLNSSPIIESVTSTISPDYHYQQFSHSETSSTIVDLESHRFTPGTRSSQQQSISPNSTSTVPYQYYHTQHYYQPTTPSYQNYTDYSSLPSQTQPHNNHHQHQQQQQLRPYTVPQDNGYSLFNGHNNYHNNYISQHNNQVAPYYSLVPPQTSQTKPMSIQSETKPAAPKTKPGPKLVWLLFMHRHGDRTPLNMAPRDRYNNITYWPEGFGNLNNAGRMRMFKLGKFIRRRYDGFLTDNIREVYSRSSDVDRCIESSHALLAGLYPPTNRYEWNKELLWVPAPVHTVPGPDDYFLGTLKLSYSPNGTNDQVIEFINEMRLVQNSEAVKKLYEDSESERKLLERELGYEFDNFQRFKCTYSTLDIEERNGLAMPAWYTPELKQKLYRFAGLAFSLAGGGTEKLKKIRCGHLLEDLVTRMEMSSIDGPKPKEQSDFQQLTDLPTVIDDRKIIHYSTHDSNMAAFLEALNVNNPTPVPPGFGATFFVELYVDLDEQGLPVSEKYIKLFYMDDTDTEKPIEKKLPNAKLNEKGQLTLNNFKKYIGNLLPSPLSSNMK